MWTKFPDQHPLLSILVRNCGSDKKRLLEKSNWLAGQGGASNRAGGPASRKPKAILPTASLTKSGERQDPHVPESVHPDTKTEGKPGQDDLWPGRIFGIGSGPGKKNGDKNTF